MSTTTTEPRDDAVEAAIAAISTIATDLTEDDHERRYLEDDLLATVQGAMYREALSPLATRQAALNVLVAEYNRVTEFVMHLVDLIGHVQSGKGAVKLDGLRAATAKLLSESSETCQQANLRLADVSPRADEGRE